MKVELLNNAKKKRVMNLLNEQYGIEKLPYLFIESGKGKFRIYSGALSKEELNMIGKNLHVELVGARLCKVDNEKARLNFDILNLPAVKSQLKTFSTIFLPDEDVGSWMSGIDLDYDTEHPVPFTYLVMKNEGDIFGMGQNAKTFIKNYVPKERRIRKPTKMVG